jgi:hypothetical protein
MQKPLLEQTEEEQINMAKRRMFSTDVIDSDLFLDMPLSSRCLYYDLGMRADDDGFVSPKKVLRVTGAAVDDLNVLITKKFILPFESGVIVIKDWKLNNYIQKDRYTETIYKEEKGALEEDENSAYRLKDTNVIQNVYKLDTQVRLGKERKGKVSLGKDTVPERKYGTLSNIGAEELQSVADFYQVPLSFVNSRLDDLRNYCQSSGKTYRDYLAALRNFVKRDAIRLRKEVVDNDKSKLAIVTPDPNWTRNTREVAREVSH